VEISAALAQPLGRWAQPRGGSRRTPHENSAAGSSPREGSRPSHQARYTRTRSSMRAHACTRWSGCRTSSIHREAEELSSSRLHHSRDVFVDTRLACRTMNARATGLRTALRLRRVHDQRSSCAATGLAPAPIDASEHAVHRPQQIAGFAKFAGSGPARQARRIKAGRPD
jgi:hypothetical protein